MTRVLRVVSAGCVVALSVGVIAAMPASANRLHRASLSPAKFSCTGAEQTYSVPAGVRALKVKAIGAPGGASDTFPGEAAGSGGQGAVVGAWVRPPRATSTMYVEVGCAGSLSVGGFNGGGTGPGDTANGGGGGGASDVRLDPMSTPLTTRDTRLVVAGGGGGGGRCSGDGGAAGDSTVTGAGAGGNASSSCPGATAGGNGGFGGTAGGAGAETALNNCTGNAGSLGQGADIQTGCDAGDPAGGGGGGYYGGGGGGDGLGEANGGGGAGSSFWVSGATHTSMAMNTTSLAPEVVITPACLVPKLKGETLAKAKTALTNAHCALGTVTKKKSTRKAGIVLSQHPKKGAILTLGSKVAVVVSKT